MHPLAAPQKDFCWRPLQQPLRLLKVWITQNQRATQKSCGAGHHKIGRGWVEWSDGGVWSWAGATASGGATKEVATSAAPTLRKPPGRSPGGPFLGLGQLGSHPKAPWLLFQKIAHTRRCRLLIPSEKENACVAGLFSAVLFPDFGVEPACKRAPAKQKSF